MPDRSDLKRAVRDDPVEDRACILVAPPGDDKDRRSRDCRRTKGCLEAHRVSWSLGLDLCRIGPRGASFLSSGLSSLTVSSSSTTALQLKSSRQFAAT